MQVTLAPLDDSRPAIRIGPGYPIVNGTASVGQEFSPDGKTIIINQSRDDEVRVVDAATGGLGRVLSWQTADMPGWQRLAP